MLLLSTIGLLVDWLQKHESHEGLVVAAKIWDVRPRGVVIIWQSQAQRESVFLCYTPDIKHRPWKMVWLED